MENGERRGGEVPAVDGEQHEGQRASLAGRGVRVGVRVRARLEARARVEVIGRS